MISLRLTSTITKFWSRVTERKLSISKTRSKRPEMSWIRLKNRLLLYTETNTLTTKIITFKPVTVFPTLNQVLTLITKRLTTMDSVKTITITVTITSLNKVTPILQNPLFSNSLTGLKITSRIKALKTIIPKTISTILMANLRITNLITPKTLSSLLFKIPGNPSPYSVNLNSRNNNNTNPETKNFRNLSTTSQSTKNLIPIIKSLRMNIIMEKERRNTLNNLNRNKNNLSIPSSPFRDNRFVRYRDNRFLRQRNLRKRTSNLNKPNSPNSL